MESNAADSDPAAELAGPKRDDRSNKSDAHSETESIVLNVPVTNVYGHCCRLEQLPLFIKSLRNVQRIDDTHFRLTTFKGSEQQRIIVQIVLRVPERRIAWQASCSELPLGVILFDPLTEDRTEITIKLLSTIEPAMLSQLTQECLANFKQLVEGQTRR
jgi:uncharacterized membrane protein